jgi:hypothetical protein
LEAVEQEGVTVHRPERGPFVERVQPMHDSYAGTPLGDLLARIKEVE